MENRNVRNFTPSTCFPIRPEDFRQDIDRVLRDVGHSHVTPAVGLPTNFPPVFNLRLRTDRIQSTVTPVRRIRAVRTSRPLTTV